MNYTRLNKKLHSILGTELNFRLYNSLTRSIDRNFWFSLWNCLEVSLVGDMRDNLNANMDKLEQNIVDTQNVEETNDA